MSQRYKVIVMGNFSVGKTCIITRFIHNKFNFLSQATVGAAFHNIRKKIDDKEVSIDLYDTAGSEKYNALMPMYYKNTDVAIIVYDVTNYGSFNRALNMVESLKNSVENVTIIFVGNKIDLKRVILKEDAQLIANKCNLIYTECSAYTGEGIDTLYNLMFEQIKLKIKPPTNNINLSSTKSLTHCCNN